MYLPTSNVKVLQMFENCKTYNTEDSVIYADAEELEREFLKAYNESRQTGEKVKVVTDGMYSLDYFILIFITT